MYFKNRNFGQMLKFPSKLGISDIKRNLFQKSKLLAKVLISVKNRNFGQKIRSKIKFS